MAEKDTESDEACVDGLRDKADTEKVGLQSEAKSDMQTDEAGIEETGTDEVNLQSDEATSSLDEEVCTGNIDKAGIHSDEASVEGRETAGQTDKVDLQSNEAIKDERDTADAGIIFCDPCLEEHDEITAVGFCVDCNDYLCKDCVKIHKKQKALKLHVLKDENEMPRSRPNQNQINPIEICPEHNDEKVTLFCKFHGDILCDICRQVDHRNCENVVILENIAKENDISEEIQKVKDKLYSLNNEFKKNDVHAKENKMAIENYHISVVEGLRKIRDKDLHMTTSIEGACDLMIRTITKMTNDIEIAREQKTHAFIQLNNAKRSIQDAEARLESIKSDNKITKYRFVSDSLLAEKPEILGAILKCPSKLDDLKVHVLGDKCECCIAGIEIMPRNQIALADHTNRKVKLVDLKNGKIISSLNLKETPLGLTRVSDKIIAVSTWRDQKLLLVSFCDDLAVQKTFDKTEIQICKGVVFSDGRLYMACSNPHQIQVMDNNGVVLNTIKFDCNVSFDDITFYSKTSSIYLSDNLDNKIHRASMDGEIQNSYSNEHSKKIRCITIGKDGRLFACLQEPDLIVELPADLSKCEVVFDKTYGISSPYSIKYNHEDCKLYVGSWNSNTVRVFLV